ncbi:MAG TPA: DUF2892 domain-containing protein [Mucilaginibacter sp.]|jgi:hypothetical protein
MKKNMGATDRIFRILIAAIIIVFYLITNLISGTTAIILLTVSGIFIATSFISFCPLYLPFGISTNGQKKKSRNSVV